jgi:squamous cell carcinoma antigen recognized by T-cells 3
VRIRNLPDATQEGLLQQALEKCVEGVRRVEVFVETGEAVVELENAAVRLFLLPCVQMVLMV